MPTPELPRLHRSDPVESVITALNQTGAVIVEDLITHAEIKAITIELKPHIDDADPDMQQVNEVLQTFFNGVRNVTGLASKSPTFVDTVLLHALLLAAAEAVIGPNSANYNLTTSLTSWPGSQAHNDSRSTATRTYGPSCLNRIPK